MRPVSTTGHIHKAYIHKAYIKIVVPFQKQINTREIAKFFVCDRIFTFRMRFKHNKMVVEFENKGNKICELFKDRPIGVLDLRSIGYYKVKLPKIDFYG